MKNLSIIQSLNLIRAKYLQKVALAITCLMFVSCNKTQVLPTKYQAEELYELGLNDLKKEKYSAASEHFKSIFEQHPTSKLVDQSEVMYSYALYMNGQYEDAADVYSNFLIYFPNSKDSDYIRYMNFLAHYNQIIDISRDQRKTMETLIAFSDLEANVSKISPYYIDASKKILLVYDYLAAEQLAVGMIRLKENNPLAAIIKFKHVLPYKSIHTQEALYRIVECYTILGLDIHAARYFGILKHNFPNSNWYAEGLENFKNYSWFSQYRKYF